MELKDHSQRAHALLSASSAHRWLQCPPSAVAAEQYPDTGSEFAAEGTLAHEVAEWVASGKSQTENLDKGLDEGVTAEMLECARAYRDYIEEQKTSDVATVLLETRVDFSDYVPDGFGTCDCIIVQDGTLDVIDYKYGQGVAVNAENNPQLRLYALGALRFLEDLADVGVEYDIQTVRMHIFQPRINNVSMEALPVDELIAWGGSIKPIAQKAAKGKGTYKPGAHCKFCPHAGKCRSLTKTCTEYVETHGLKVGVPTLAPFEVAEVLQMEPLISLWLKRVKDQAKTTLLEGGEIPGFKVVEGKLGNRKWTDELQVAEKLKAEGYQLNDITETKLLSPAGMDKSIGKKKVTELLEGYIDRAPGAPTVVPDTDKRPAYDRLAEAQNDFI